MGRPRGAGVWQEREGRPGPELPGLGGRGGWAEGRSARGRGLGGDPELRGKLHPGAKSARFLYCRGVSSSLFSKFKFANLRNPGVKPPFDENIPCVPI